MKNISILLNISLIIAAIMLTACDDDYEPSIDSESVDCYYCYEELPQYVEMKLEFNMWVNVEKVYYTVYSGYAFASEVYMTGECDVNNLWIDVIPDQKYTVVAEYKRSGKVIHAINDCTVKTEYFKYACDEPCYYVYEAVCDLKVKDY